MVVVRADNLRVVPNGHTDFVDQAKQVKGEKKDFRSRFEAAKAKSQAHSAPRNIFVREHLAAAVERGMVDAGRRAYRSMGEPVKKSIDDAVRTARESGMTEQEADVMGHMIAGALRANGVA